MINVAYLCIILHIFFSFLLETCIFKTNLFKQILTTPFIYVFISLCVNKSL